MNGDYKEEVNVWRAYQKELFNYQKAKKRIEELERENGRILSVVPLVRLLR